MPDNAPSIRFEHIAFSYGGRAVLNDVCADVPAESLTCVLGPNGCGKSTLVKLADGLLKPDAGQILVEGVPVSSFKPRERARRIAVLAQTNQIPSMTVEQLVACGRYPYAQAGGRLDENDRAAIERALSTCGLDDLANMPLDELSGGQRQRAFIAMVDAQDASIMLLDEPTTYLDVSACHEVLGLLRTLVAARHAAACVIIHDLDLALRYADHLIVIEDGRAVQGTCAELLDSGDVQRVFNVEVDVHDSARGRGYVVFPIERPIPAAKS